jgi:hypothetical protein
VDSDKEGILELRGTNIGRNSGAGSKSWQNRWKEIDRLTGKRGDTVDIQIG